MSIDYKEKIYNLLLEASSSQSISQSHAFLIKAIELADKHQDNALQFETRTEYLLACFKVGYHDKILVTFPWLLDYAEKHSDEIPPETIMQLYILVVNGITEFPSIDKKQIEGVLQQMEESYRKGGYSLKEAYKIARHAYLEMGCTKEAEAYSQKIAEAPGGFFLHQCKACDAFSEVTYLNHLGLDDEAYKVAKPLITGELSCEYQEGFSLISLLTSLVRLGHMDEAVRLYKEAFQRKSITQNTHLWYGYKFVAFMVLTKNLDKACHYFENFLKQACEYHAKGLSFLFFLAGKLLLRQLLQENKKEVKLTLYPEFPLFNETNLYDIHTLLNWFETEIKTLEGLFNQRNGNTFFSKLVTIHEDLEIHISKEKIDLTI